MRNLFLFLVMIFIIGCVKVDNSEKYIGEYTYGFETEIFTDEKTKVNYWLVGEKIEELNKILQEEISTGKNPYPIVKIQVIGIDRGKENNEFSSPNDRRLEVLKYKILDEK